MERIIATVYQIEECKKLILKGDIFSFRMAFVLLDNVAEILMYRRIQSDLAFNEIWLRHDEMMKTQSTTTEYKKWRKNRNIVSRKRKYSISRYFDEKIKFLSEEKSTIRKSEASTLRSLHKYRNEIYHEDKVRRETVQTSTLLLYEIVCKLLPRLHPGSIGYYSGNPDREERRVFFEKYKNAKTTNNMLKDNGLIIIMNSLRRGISLDCNELRKVLQQTLKDRILISLESIDFVMRDGFQCKTREKALKLIQLIHSGKLHGPIDYKEPLRNFTPKYTMKNFSTWRKKIKKLKELKSKVKLFKAFSAIETEFEKLETMLATAAMELDLAIQHKIDMMRGK
ncbi:MAG: hypothetical protein KAS46_05575 [Candidatus Aureabacteria bacterium]|nr:hypothetical protein [Candidatus Auribacterota bacterium]